MLKLRNILLCDYVYYIILLVLFIYFILVGFVFKKDTCYKDFNNEKFKIVNILKKDDMVTLTLKGKEKVLGKYLCKGNFPFSLGDSVIVSGDKLDISSNTVPNTFNYKKYLNNQRIYNVVKIRSIKLCKKNKNIFYGIKNILLERKNKLNLTDDYIDALIFGNNKSINLDVKDSYQENGISHLFAISGLHISFFTGFISKFLKKIKVKENNRYNILIFFLIFYMFLTGFSMSVMRGTIFNILIIINKKYYFYIKPVNLLILTLCIIMTINSLYIYNVGLQFSFIISLFLIIFSDLINKRKSFIGKLLVTSFISFLASYPIVINNFYQVNFLSIIYNIFFVPFVSYLILPLAIISFIFPFLDNVYFFFINILENISLYLSNINCFKIIMCKLNLFFILFYYLLILFILFSYKNKNKNYLLLLLIFLFFHFLGPFNSKEEIVFLDVGQGDSALININNNITLIDTGGVLTYGNKHYTYSLSKNKILPYLKSLGIRKIDNLVLTHGDADHMRESLYIVDKFKVQKVIFNVGSYNDLELDLIKVLKKNKITYYKNVDSLDINNNKLYFLNTKIYDNENDNSNVIYTNINNKKILLMGDAGKDKELDIIDKYNIKDIDILKVGHHGSDTSSCKEFIDIIKPKKCIISVGKNNRFGHPKKSVIDILDNYCDIYRTDLDGSIKFNFKD